MEIKDLESNDIDVKYSITEQDIKDGYVVKPGDDNRKEVEVEISWNKDSTNNGPIEVNFNITMNYEQASNAVVTTSSSSDSFPVVQGSLGNNITYTYDNGSISIDGTGEMNDNVEDYCADFAPAFGNHCALTTEISAKIIDNLVDKDDTIRNSVLSYLPYAVGGVAYDKDELKTNLTDPNGDNLSETDANRALEVLDKVPSIKSINIQNGITSIRPELFASIVAHDITITFPNTISSKTDLVFDLSEIGTVTFESGTKTIYEGMCTTSAGFINNIVIPDGVEKIETRAIYSSDGGLTTLTIPSSVTIIENNAISGNNLTTIVNKTGNKFDWNGILTGTSGEAFETGTVEYNGKTITITNE